jgi:hypothetical protein
MRRIRFARWALLAVFPASMACLSAADPPVPSPPTKKVVEFPVKEAVAKSAPTPPTDNPTVDTGKVKWHKTLDDAQAAAKKSNKPVLLFQMMGYLDKKFC